MKKSIKTTLLAAALAACAFAPCLSNVISADAGASRANVASEATVVDGRINTGDFMIDGGVSAEGATMIFKDSCSVIGKTKINNLGKFGVKTLFQGNLSLEFTALAENGGVFSVCFGLQGLTESRTSKGVLEMRFFEDNGINFVVYEHCDEGISNVLLSSRPLQVCNGQEGDTAALAFNVTSTGELTLSMNGEANPIIEGKKLYEGGDGYFAMFSEGENLVKVSDMSLYGYSYDTPENVNYTETFDNGGYNSNVFYSTSKVSPLSPSYLTVEDGALKFSNTAGAHITTRHAYSNFEMEFDVTDLQREAVYDENGNITKLISNWFAIAFGVDNPDQAPESTIPMSVCLQLEGMRSDEVTDQTQPNAAPRLILWDKGTPQHITDMPYNIWDASFKNKIVNVKFSIDDGVIQLWMKTSEDAKYGDPVFEYNLGYTPSGHVRVYTWGQTATLAQGLQYNSIANFTMDNLSIKNTDYEGAKKLTTVEYKSNVMEATPDYEYTTQPDENDLLINRWERVDASNGGCTSTIGAVTVLPIIGAVACALLRKGRKEDE